MMAPVFTETVKMSYVKTRPHHRKSLYFINENEFWALHV